jgi:hypothetical protein
MKIKIKVQDQDEVEDGTFRIDSDLKGGPPG